MLQAKTPQESLQGHSRTFQGPLVHPVQLTTDGFQNDSIREENAPQQAPAVKTEIMNIPYTHIYIYIYNNSNSNGNDNNDETNKNYNTTNNNDSNGAKNNII